MGQKVWRFLFITVAGPVAALLLMGCGSNGSTTHGDQDDDGPLACVSSDDCPLGQVCTAGFCQEPTTVDGDEVEREKDPEPDLTEEAVPEPDIQVASELDFGAVLFGDRRERTLTVTNVGDAPLAINVVRLVLPVGALTTDFSFEEPEDPIDLSPQESTSYVISYSPTDNGTDEAWLEINSDDPDEGTVRVHLFSEYKGTVSIAVDPAQMSFGSVRVGRQEWRVLTIANQKVGENDNRNLVVNDLIFEPSGQTTFVLDMGDLSLPLLIPPGSEREVAIGFLPLAETAFAATLVIDNNDPDISDALLSVPLAGQGDAPHITVNLDPLDFGKVKVGTRAVMDLVVGNSGGWPLTLTAAGLDVMGDPQITILSQPAIPEGGYLVGLDSSYVITVAYDPDQPVAHGHTVVIESDDQDLPLREVPVTGSGMESGLTTDSAGLDFGQVRVGAVKVLNMGVINEGEAPVTVSHLSWINEGAGRFYAESLTALPVTLEAGERFEVEVTYAPGAEEADQAVFTLVSDNNGDDPQVSLTGEGIDAHLQVVEPLGDTLNLGEVVLGTTGSGAIVVGNTGAYPLTISLVRVVQGSNPYFSVSAAPASPLAFGQQAAFTVTYAPPLGSDTGTYNGAVTIASDDPDQPEVVVNVAAKSVSPQLEVFPSHDLLDLGRAIVGCQATPLQVTLRNVGGLGTLIVERIEKVTGTHSSFGIQGAPTSPVLLRPYGASSDQFTFTLTYAPTGADTHQGWIRIISNAMEQHETVVALTGQGYLCQANEHICNCTCVLNTAVEHCGNRCEPCPEELSFAQPVCRFDTSQGLFNCGYQCIYGYTMQNDICVPSNDPACCGTTCTDCTDAVPANSTGICTDSYQCDYVCVGSYHRCTSDDGCFANTDPTRCGLSCEYCNAPINATPLCVSNHCDYQCNLGFHECLDGLCYRDTDATHCGASCEACTPPEHGYAQCQDGACQFQCEPNYHKVGNKCLLNNVSSCCGMDCDGCTVPAGSHADPVCIPDTGDTYKCWYQCWEGWRSCDYDHSNGCETNIYTDVFNCGSCGGECELPFTTAYRCVTGVCQVAGCVTNRDNCNRLHPDGCEAQLLNEDKNCGQCDNDCDAKPHVSAARCASGGCVVDLCQTGWGDCMNAGADGCETDITTGSNCGQCGRSCNDLPNVVSAQCLGGGCVITQCSLGYDNCDTNPYNGCETRLADTTAHCGACNNNCNTKPNVGSAHCTDSLCVVDNCQYGFGDCMNGGTDGCETSLLTADTHCGVCGNNCDTKPGVVAAHCASGSCTVDQCGQGLGDCYNGGADGCETSTDTSASHCGSCTLACDLPHAGSHRCVGGSCKVDLCDPGYGNCNPSHVDGCETYLLNDVNNCNACGALCTAPANATASCLGGVCAWTCNTGYHSCGGSTCYPDSDTSHCGTNTSCQECADDKPHSDPLCVANQCALSCDTGYADCGGGIADGCETSILTDTSNCSGCGKACDLDNTNTHECVAGVCKVLSCDASYGNCNPSHSDGCEAQLLNEDKNCGQCDNDCDAKPHVSAARCASGGCVVDLCQTGWGDCMNAGADGCETDLTTNEHCGNCSTNCGNLPHVQTTHCSATGCVIDQCATGYLDCNGVVGDGCEKYVDGMDDANCGACGNNCDTKPNIAGAHCTSGVCYVDSCQAGFGDCYNGGADGCETNTGTSDANCGLCGNNCDTKPGVVAAHCTSGSCFVDTCATGLGDCTGGGADGCETDTNTSASHCSACGVACNLPHVDTHLCVGGSCKVDLCDPGYGNCNPSHVDGCEVYLLSDVNNCNACGALCTAPANATASCLGGVCAWTCNTGYHSCGGSTCYPDSDTDHCGTNTSCQVCTDNKPHSDPLCVANQCALSCDTGYADCGGGIADGCETSILTDAYNCSGCGRVCDLDNTNIHECVAGVCKVLSCDANYGNCNPSHLDGCETYLPTTLAHCGTCNYNCAALPHVNAVSCTSSQCVISTCQSGWGNCSGGAVDGCETDLTTNEHCGNCSTNCGNLPHVQTTHCSATGCIIDQCATGYLNCNGLVTDGCEANINSDGANCGTCGNNCHTKPNIAGAHCTSGVCYVDACQAGFGDCYNGGADGCETNINANDANCGACGNNCDTKQNVSVAHCTSRACYVDSCTTGWGDCSGGGADGCETYLDGADENHCGSCTTVCDNLAQVANGHCAAGDCLVDTCDTNWGNCYNGADDGCETSLSNNNSHCGACFNNCSTAKPNVASASCSGTSCRVDSCSSGYDDCNTTWSDGCEFNHTTYANTAATATNMYLLGSSSDVNVCGDDGDEYTNTVRDDNNRWYKVEVEECYDWDMYLSIGYYLTCPAGVRYELCVYEDGYGSGDKVGCVQCAPGGTVSTCLAWGDTWLSTDTEWHYLEVKYVSGSGCGTYALYGRGNIDCE